MSSRIWQHTLWLLNIIICTIYWSRRQYWCIFRLGDQYCLKSWVTGYFNTNTSHTSCICLTFLKVTGLCLKLSMLLEIFTTTLSSLLVLRTLFKKKKKLYISVPAFSEEYIRQYFDDAFMLGIRRTPANKGMRWDSRAPFPKGYWEKTIKSISFEMQLTN